MLNSGHPTTPDDSTPRSDDEAWDRKTLDEIAVDPVPAFDPELSGALDALAVAADAIANATFLIERKAGLA